jgi:hypothetical protein
MNNARPELMKTSFAIATFIIALLDARLMAADPIPLAASVERQFQQADVQLAIEQYRKLRMAASELALKALTEPNLSDEQRRYLDDRRAQLEMHAERLREQTLKSAADALASGR